MAVLLSNNIYTIIVHYILYPQIHIGLGIYTTVSIHVLTTDFHMEFV